jgi:regulator of sigma E protease
MHLFGLQITLIQIAATVFGIGILVFIHELGHFFMAKLFKLKVEKFTLGFGPEIIGFSHKETRYSLCWIPLGGMVKMPGEDIDSATGSPDEFLSQPWYKRAIIAFFGPLMNYILAVLIFTSVIFVWGLDKPSQKTIIGEPIDGYPAYKAGLKKDDLIKKINGREFEKWEEAADFIHKHPNEELDFTIARDNKDLDFKITTVKEPSSGVGVIGISPLMETEKVGLIPSAGYSVKIVIMQTELTFTYLGQKLIKWEKPDLAGPIGVVQVLAKAAKAGFQNLLYFLGVISVALGLFNLLPIPIVDGGHIMFAIIEAVTRKKNSKKMLLVSNFIGLAIIFGILILATYNDLLRLGLKF